MANIHALRDEVVRKRTDLIQELNKMYAEYPAEAKQAYELCLMQIHDYFKGNDEPREPVEEKSDNLSPN